MHRILSAILGSALLLTVSVSIASANGCAGGYAPTVRIAGLVKEPKTYTLADLQKLTTSKVTVSWYSGRDGFVTSTYIGVPLLDLINAAQPITNPAQHNDILRKYVLVTATDCYQGTIALGEILPNFNGEQVIVAFADGNGNPLPTEEGMARIIVPDSKAGGRNVSNVTRIIVREPGPAPQAAE